MRSKDAPINLKTVRPFVLKEKDNKGYDTEVKENVE
jgi:hypothetical protein